MEAAKLLSRILRRNSAALCMFTWAILRRILAHWPSTLMLSSMSSELEHTWVQVEASGQLFFVREAVHRMTLAANSGSNSNKS